MFLPIAKQAHCDVVVRIMEGPAFDKVLPKMNDFLSLFSLLGRIISPLCNLMQISSYEDTKMKILSTPIARTKNGKT